MRASSLLRLFGLSLITIAACGDEPSPIVDATETGSGSSGGPPMTGADDSPPPVTTVADTSGSGDGSGDTSVVDDTSTGEPPGTSSDGGSSDSGSSSGDESSTGCVPEEEVCDGNDNDCDDEIDEGCTCRPGTSQACYDGDPGTIDVGVCVEGTQDCADDGLSFEPCTGQVLPSAEVCNGADDDCDGAVDDGFGGETCGVGSCQVTIDSTCENGAPVVCTPGDPVAEICINGLDDDCDGTADDGCACNEGQDYPCYGGPAGTAGVGLCAEGTATCTGGQLGACNGDVVPVAEECNGDDDDCDGTDDNGDPGGGDACSTGQIGPCDQGTTACVGGSVECEQTVFPGPEACNGDDDDCDGITDEGNPGGNAPCSTGLLGVCDAGTTNCQLGSLFCDQNVQPSAESCDALDNDCDGMTDEGNPGGGAACSTGLPGVCDAGTLSCAGGSPTCNQNTAASAEVCDGLDNDCDGTADEGNPGGGAACDTGLAGACAPGTQTCTGGSVQCVPNVTPDPETCDNVDNDCDGTVDNGNPGGGAACDTGVPGVCSEGVITCGGGGVLYCGQTFAPSAEACDGEDNDCDGSTDEGNPGSGVFCNTGLEGVCTAGTTSCSGGALQCNQNVGSSTEVCDDLDNDCDGFSDENNVCCPHSVCTEGASLGDDCTTCTTAVCAVDPTCCTTAWDAVCVDLVIDECSSFCPSHSGTCLHSPCVGGGALISGCDEAGCVATICALDPFCCQVSWDGFCVNEVPQFCGLTCIN